MRLIDLDKVRWTEGFYDMHTGEQFAPMMLNTEEWLEWATANAKVKAIPIDFIKAFSEFLLDRRERFVLETLIEVWEGKRETKVPYINQMLDNYTKEMGERK